MFELQEDLQSLILREHRARTRAAELAERKAEVELEAAEVMQQYQAWVIAQERRNAKKW